MKIPPSDINDLIYFNRDMRKDRCRLDNWNAKSVTTNNAQASESPTINTCEKDAVAVNAEKNRQ